MNSITLLFDKSFLQMLNVDESVWFDHFFLPVVCPILYSEILSDLKKNYKSNRIPEKEVSNIASKFPEKNGFPCAHDSDLVYKNLIGESIPMDGRIAASGGKLKKNLNTFCIVKENISEANDFLRWAEKHFTQEEYDSASELRKAFENPKHLDLMKDIFIKSGINEKNCKSLPEAKKYADRLLQNSNKKVDGMEVLLEQLGINYDNQKIIIERWRSLGCKPITDFAPYAAHVLSVDLFFHIARTAGLINQDSSSWRDICYLHYLPFCKVFVSNDNLHQKFAPFFMRSDQKFIWGDNLKKDLNLLNAHYKNIPDDFKEKGIDYFAYNPPKTNNLITELWDCYFPNWRNRAEYPNKLLTPEASEKINNIKKLIKEKELSKSENNLNNADSLLVIRNVRKIKGSWTVI